MKNAKSGVPITKTDPDLIAARKIVSDTLPPADHRRCNCREQIAAGAWDQRHKIRATLAGIRLGKTEHFDDPFWFKAEAYPSRDGILITAPDDPLAFIYQTPDQAREIVRRINTALEGVDKE